MKRLPLAVSFVLFILLCASIAYWGMQLFKPPLRPVAAPPKAAAPEIRPDAATALFGGRAAPAQVASNYQLRGVIFSGNARDSIAILSADGKPPQAVRVDMEVLPGVVVKEVHRGYVLLSDNGATKRIELPEDAKSGGVTAAPVPAVPAVPSQPGRNFPAPARPPAVTPQPQPAAPTSAGQPARPVPNATPGTPQAGIPQPAAPASVPASPAPGAPVPGAAGQPTTAPPTVVVNPPAGTPPATQSLGGVPLPNVPQVPQVPNVPNPGLGGPPASGSTAPGEPPLQSR